ncbi:Beta-glucosidase BoGH3B [Pelomyxa schiedti]|nr:Beta-glucosidase BoGH3B [Pelomyxa schiedti]
MTLQEKVNQLLVPTLPTPDELLEQYGDTGVGAYYLNSVSSCWTGTAPNGTGAEQRNQLQSAMMAQSRLAIPIEFIQESLHGGACGGTIFPMPINLACTWNTTLVQEVHRTIAVETRITGATRSFSPNINLYTDPRFGRYQEGWGEDPFLTASMATASINGLQGTLNENGYYDFNSSIIATTKHFAAYGVTRAGQDGSAADISERTLREVYFQPFQAAVKAGTASIMPSHNEITHLGLPSHASTWLLETVLRGEWGWDGMLTSDWNDISGLQGYRLAKTEEDAATLALSAGVDMDLSAYSYPYLVDAVKDNKVSVDQIDRAVRRVLKVKFSSGVFDAPFAYTERLDELDSSTNRELAKEAAIQSIVLLKNTGNILPLSSTIKSVAVIGPLANDSYSQPGGYTNYGAHVVTPLEAIQSYGGAKGMSVTYQRGCNVMDKDLSMVQSAVDAACNSDVALVFVGDTQDTCEESWGGRYGDRPSIDLAGGQLYLLDALLTCKKPVVCTLIHGRPATFGTAASNNLLSALPALLASWRPGEEGGNAITSIIFGDRVPGGKLVSSWPFSAGQIYGPSQPYYQKFREYDGRMYTFEPSTPLFPFGFGLSYTQFALSNLIISPATLSPTGTVSITCTIKNTGTRTGTEVVQLYIGDDIASVVRWEMQLFGFSKVSLSPGRSTQVSFTVAATQLAFYTTAMDQLIVEPGQFNVWVTTDSSLPQSSTLSSSFTVTS